MSSSSDTYTTTPTNHRPVSSKWKIISAITGLSCLICILAGVLLVNNSNSNNANNKRTVSSNNNVNVASLNSQTAIDEYISAIVESSTPRPTNRIVPRPTGRPSKRPSRPTARPTNRIVPRPSGRPSNRPTNTKPSGRPTNRPRGRPTNRPTNEMISIVITNRPTPRPVEAEGMKLGECMGDCDTDNDCESGLTCFQRNANEEIPGCPTNGVAIPPSYDFCIDPSKVQVITTDRPTPNPTPRPTPNPTPRPTPNPVPAAVIPDSSSNSNNNNCFTSQLYNEIDSDISLLALTISNPIERSHFLGGIVRLAAHDFMDYDRFSSRRYGADGCFDPNHDANAGLPEGVWCHDCLLRGLYETKYSFVSRADFWIAAANAVIRQTSVNNVLDLRNTFKWGRRDTSNCPGSGDRVPSPNGCDDVEGTFIGRMGMEWKDAVALMGAHAIGRGDADNSGHEGTWSDNAAEAMIFDKSYYKELFNNAWHPRNRGTTVQDWTLDDTDPQNPRMMLNTDLCLVYDIERANNNCCTIEGSCRSDPRLRQCPIYDEKNKRREAADAVIGFIGESMEDDDNMSFYLAFAEAWETAINLGWEGELSSLDICNGQNVFD